METPQGEERERRTEEILETMTGNFRQLMSDIKPQRINAKKKKKKQTQPTGPSLVVQWLKSHLPAKDCRFRLWLVSRDPIRRRAAKPMHHI